MKKREGLRFAVFVLVFLLLALNNFAFASTEKGKEQPPAVTDKQSATDIEENVSGEVIQEHESNPAPADTGEKGTAPAVEEPSAPAKEGPAPPEEEKKEEKKEEQPAPEKKDATTPASGENKETPQNTEGTTPPGEEVTPRVTAIVVEGNTSISSDDILKVISAKIGDPVVNSRVQRDIQAIFDLGYFTDVRVDTRFFLEGVKLIFTVLENPVVKEIEIQGNKLVPSSKIIELMDTKVGKVLNTKELYGDMGAINQYYDEELGYLLKPTHIKDLQWTEEGRLIISLQEGMVIQQIEVTGSSVFPADQLNKYITLKPGDLFNQKVLKTDTDKIANLYEKKDYILDTIRPNIDPKKGLVSIKVIEAVVEEIRVEGNKRTKEYVVKRNLNTKVGQVLRKRRLQRDLERLNNIGYFSSVNIDPEAGSEPGKLVLVVKVKEQKTGLATLGVGYTGGGSGAVRSGVTGAISLSERNFGGKGYGGSIQWQRGVNVDSLSASFFDPAINDNRDSLGFSIYRSSVTEIQQAVTGSSPVVYALYDYRNSGGNATYGHPLSDDLSLFLTLKSERLELIQSANSEYLAVGMGSGTANSAVVSGLYDTRDDMFNPLRGSYASGSYQVAGTFLGGDYQFNKAQLEIRQYYPVWKNKTIALRAWGGVLNGTTPATEYFYVGGADTIRGYPENSFYGSRMLVFNAEFRFPIAKIKILNGAVFADAGKAWFPGQDSTLMTDAGVGIRLVFPTLGLGVIRIDYAFGKQGSRSTIGIGQTF